MESADAQRQSRLVAQGVDVRVETDADLHPAQPQPLTSTTPTIRVVVDMGRHADGLAWDATAELP